MWCLCLEEGLGPARCNWGLCDWCYMYGECTVEAYSQSLVILKMMFEWCYIVWVLRWALCVVRNAERTWWSSVKIGQQRGWSRRSPSERKTMLSLREVMAKDPARGQMSLSCGSTDSRCWATDAQKSKMSSGYVWVRLVRIDMFSSSTAARRPTEVSTIATLVVRTLKFGRVSERFSKTDIKRWFG